MPRTIIDSGAKKATVYHFRLTKDVDWDALSKLAYNPEQSLNADLARMGLVHPLSDLGLEEEDTVLETFQGGYLTALRIDKSVVTNTAIRQAVAVEINARLEGLDDSEALSRAERGAIAEAIRGKLLDAAPLVSKYVPIIIDTARNRVIIFDTSEKIIDAVLTRLNNAFAGVIALFGLTQLAVKASIPNIGIKLLDILTILHQSDDDVTDELFAGAPRLSFGTGVKLAKLDDTAGNHANLPGVDVTDDYITPLLERATFVDRLGLFLPHGQTDVEFQINAQLQFTKLGLANLVAEGLDNSDIDFDDVVAQVRATAMLLTDAVNTMTDAVSGFLGLPITLDDVGTPAQAA